MRSFILGLVAAAGMAFAANCWAAGAYAADNDYGANAVMPAVLQTVQAGENQTNVGVPVTPVAVRVAVADGWRYRWSGGRWWYWMPSNRWVYWYGGNWVDYGAGAQVYTYSYAPNYSYSYPYYSYYPYSYYYPRYSYYYPRYYGPRVYVGVGPRYGYRGW